MTNVLLDDILALLPFHQAWGPIKEHQVKCMKICLHSQYVESDTLFVAVRGAQHNGEDYIPSAIQQGASIILAAREGCASLHSDFPHIVFIGVNDVRAALSKIIKLFYPHQPTHIVGVTGTNGKTSVAEFARQIWMGMGMKAASLGTIGCNINGALQKGALTTPDPILLHQTLEDLSKEPIDYVAMEASSHGLDQCRLHAIELAAVGFTNLSRDHLDYHKTMGAYFEAKKKLFTCFPGAIAVLNADVPEFSTLRSLCKGRKIITYGKSGETLEISCVKTVFEGLEITIRAESVRHQLTLPLAGRFQLGNVLCAAGLVWACCPGRLQEIIEVLPTLHAVPGRMEHVVTYRGAQIYVDFAHTPNALEMALIALRHHSVHRVHVLFGCGGNRDRGKRSEMGAIAAKLADDIIVSDDNPRFEDPANIRKEIIQGCPQASNIGNRGDAIQVAIQNLNPGDILLIAGKGNESGQTIGDKIIPFQDREEALRCVRSMV